jgi:hypothetical protein
MFPFLPIPNGLPRSFARNFTLGRFAMVVNNLTQHLNSSRQCGYGIALMLLTAGVRQIGLFATAWLVPSIPGPFRNPFHHYSCNPSPSMLCVFQYVGSAAHGHHGPGHVTTDRVEHHAATLADGNAKPWQTSCDDRNWCKLKKHSKNSAGGGGGVCFLTDHDDDDESLFSLLGRQDLNGIHHVLSMAKNASAKYPSGRKRTTT